jgi:penicillin-binding protein 1A
VLLVALLAVYALAASYVYLAPDLPSSESMRKVELQIPLRVYTRNGALMAQIGEQRRIPAAYADIPLQVKQAFLAAEDERFFSHHGIDFPGLMRAIYVDLVSGDRAQGASTITMQAARNMFLSQDKTWRRKLEEAFLTYRMEHEFTKEEIFGLYLNVIFFGQRAYGVAAASEIFFGKTLAQLTVAQAATLGGIPKAPSRYNPIVNPQAAIARRSYVLRRMLDLGFIDATTAQSANQEPMAAHLHAPLYDVDAPDVAEMARQDVRTRFGAGAENAGYRVYTTVDSRLQAAATRAVRVGLIEYDRRHGFRGAIAHKEVGTRTRPEDFEAVLERRQSLARDGDFGCRPWRARVCEIARPGCARLGRPRLGSPRGAPGRSWPRTQECQRYSSAGRYRVCDHRWQRHGAARTAAGRAKRARGA